MILSKETIEHDNDRWANRNLLTELKYCGNNVKDRKKITNDDLHFYSYLIRSAAEALNPTPIPVDTKYVGLSGDREVFCCFDCRITLDPTFSYCPNCGAKLDWSTHQNKRRQS